MSNASISANTQLGTALNLPVGPMQTVALGDVNQNLLKTTDNGDGTSTLAVASTAASTVTTATLANVASSATTVNLFASATSLHGRTVYNDSTAVLYLKYGATASTTSYTVQIGAGGYYEFPQPAYAGAVDGIWASANGTARLTSW